MHGSKGSACCYLCSRPKVAVVATLRHIILAPWEKRQLQQLQLMVVLEYWGSNKVSHLGCDQLESGLLPVFLLLNERPHFRIILRQRILTGPQRTWTLSARNLLCTSQKLKHQCTVSYYGQSFNYITGWHSCSFIPRNYQGRLLTNIYLLGNKIKIRFFFLSFFCKLF